MQSKGKAEGFTFALLRCSLSSHRKYSTRNAPHQRNAAEFEKNLLYPAHAARFSLFMRTFAPPTLPAANDFVKPKDPRELAHLGLASNFRASESRSQACLDYAERSRKSQRTFVQVRAEAKPAWIMPSAAESLKGKSHF